MLGRVVKHLAWKQTVQVSRHKNCKRYVDIYIYLYHIPTKVENRLSEIIAAPV